MGSGALRRSRLLYSAPPGGGVQEQSSGAQELPCGEWRIEEAPGLWAVLSPDVGSDLLAAYYAGKTEAVYVAEGTPFKVDFAKCLATEEKTGKQRRIGFVPSDGSKSESKEWKEPARSQPESEGGSASSLHLGGKWLVEESPNNWQSLGAEASALLLVAWYCGDKRLEYSSEGASYDVDFNIWEQTNKLTGKKQRIGWIASSAETNWSEAEPSSGARDFSQDEEKILLAALASSERLSRYSFNGCDYEVDSVEMTLKNLTTDEQWSVAVDSFDSSGSKTGVREASPDAGSSEGDPQHCTGGVASSMSNSEKSDAGDKTLLPEGWEKRVSKSTGKAYFVNLATGKSAWKLPTQASDSSRASYPAPFAEAARLDLRAGPTEIPADESASSAFCATYPAPFAEAARFDPRAPAGTTNTESSYPAHYAEEARFDPAEPQRSATAKPSGTTATQVYPAPFAEAARFDSRAKGDCSQSKEQMAGSYPAPFADEARLDPRARVHSEQDHSSSSYPAPFASEARFNPRAETRDVNRSESSMSTYPSAFFDAAHRDLRTEQCPRSGVPAATPSASAGSDSEAGGQQESMDSDTEQQRSSYPAPFVEAARLDPRAEPRAPTGSSEPSSRLTLKEQYERDRILRGAASSEEAAAKKTAAEKAAAERDAALKAAAEKAAAASKAAAERAAAEKAAMEKAAAAKAAAERAVAEKVAAEKAAAERAAAEKAAAVRAAAEKAAAERAATEKAADSKRPRVHIYKAEPDPNWQRRPQKKWSLGPGQQWARPKAAPRDGAAEAPPGAKASPQPGARPGPLPTQPGPPPGRSKGEAQFVLPKGVEWPKAENAKRVAEALFGDMGRSRKEPLEQRRRAYLAICLSWHPDKNPKHQDVATQVFQFLQAVKAWYFGSE